MKPIILGSSSLTRAQLLQKFGIPFTQRECGFDEEQLRISEPAHFVYHATKGKMQSYLESYDLELPVLCADTVVTANGEILRKAKDKEDARRILEKQSGNKVSILTCMMYKSSEYELIDLSSTEYLFLPFDSSELDAYLEGDEWMEHKKRRFYRYKLKDIMLGAEVNLKYGRWLRDIVFEYLYTKYQSGPYNHDHTMYIPDHLAGMNDYFNHGICSGWQQW